MQRSQPSTESTKESLGQRAADFISATLGSWPFIIGQTFILILWLAINSISLFHPIWWDHRPFILLNLCLSLQAAFTGPIVMISQNRQEEISKAVMLGIRDTQHHQMLMIRALQTLLEEQRQHLVDLVEADDEITSVVEEILDRINNSNYEEEDYDDGDTG